MDAIRFETLAQAHGAAIARWPAAEQDAAFAFLAQAPETAQAALADAQALDEALDVLRPPPPSAALREAVIAAAPAPHAFGARAWTLRRWLAGLSVGAALATACAAGIVVGAGVTRIDGVEATADDETLAASTDEDWIVLPETENQS